MQTPKHPLTAAEAGHFLSYNEADGTFTRRNSNYAGRIVKGINRGSEGMKIEIRNRAYSVQNIAYLLTTGAWPQSTVFHVDGDRKNNRWSNLTTDRTATDKAKYKAQDRFQKLKARGIKSEIKANSVHDLEGERWASIPASGYYVSTLGRFKGPNGELTGTVAHTGYRHVGIKMEGAKSHSYFLAHRVVASAFADSGGHPVVNHIDGNRLNNRLDNLEWCSRSHNAKDMWSRKADVQRLSPRFAAAINRAVFLNTL